MSPDKLVDKNDPYTWVAKTKVAPVKFMKCFLFSHVFYVIPVVEVGNRLFNFMVRLSDHDDARGLYFDHGHENGSRLF